MKNYFVYILSSGRNGTLYLGVTSDLVRRVYEHKSKVFQGFASENNVDRLVWYEVHEDVRSAIIREKQIKKWRRAWKKELIEKTNPYWHDLHENL